MEDGDAGYPAGAALLDERYLQLDDGCPARVRTVLVAVSLGYLCWLVSRPRCERALSLNNCDLSYHSSNRHMRIADSELSVASPRNLSISNQGRGLCATDRAEEGMRVDST